jgi:hypothetical protein
MGIWCLSKVPVKGFNKGGQERDQSFGTDLIGRFPCQEEGLLDFWSIVGETRLLALWLQHLWMVEKLNGVFTHIAGDGNEFV